MDTLRESCQEIDNILIKSQQTDQDNHNTTRIMQENDTMTGITTSFRILYVDDEAALLDIGQICLERTNEFVVDIALSVKNAYVLLNNTTYDAIISDYDMPEHDGISFLKEIRSSGNDIPFIIFTGRGREEIVIEAINNGVDFYLQKGGMLQSTFAELIHKLKIAIERRKAQITIHESRQQLSDIIENFPDPMFAINTNHEVIAWNRAMERHVGVSADLMIGKGKYEYAVPFYGTKRSMLIDLVLQPDPEIEKTYPEFRREGDIITGEVITHFLSQDRYIRGRASPLYSKDNTISGSIVTYQDITFHKLAELQTITQKELFQTIVSHSADWEYWEGPNKQIIFCSPSSALFTGYTDEEIKSDPSIIHRLIHPDDGDQWKRYRSGYRCSHDDHHETFRIITKNGTIKWIDHVCRPVYGGNGEYMGHIVSNRDITRFIDLQTKLEETIFHLSTVQKELIASEQEIREQYRLLAESEHVIRIDSIPSEVMLNEKC